jgi:hypothetical protein
MDFYLNNDNCTKRLINEYEKYKKLIVVYDFDNTVYDFHSKGYKFDKVIDLIRECYNLDFYLIVYTCSNKDRYKYIEQYLIKNNIPFDSINENSPDINFAHGKLYYNILLDDRAGLSSAYESLKECIKYIKQGR